MERGIKPEDCAFWGDECIKEGILAEFLRKNKAEAIAVSIFEYREKRK